MTLKLAVAALVAFLLAPAATARVPVDGPESHLPSGMTQLTWFGERPSWSPDGKRIAFMSKSFGDAFEIDLATRRIRLVTHFPNAGYLRVQFLPNGDYLLIGARQFADFDRTRYYDQEFWLLKADGRSEAVPLGQKVSEGVAISRGAMKIAWANDFRTSPATLPEGECAIYTGEIDQGATQPRIVNKREVVHLKTPSCRLEAQDFRNGDGELIYVVYRDTPTVRLADVYGVDLKTLKTTVYRRVEDEYNEVEGIFPDGRHALVESSRGQEAPRGSKTIDIWKLRLEPGSQDYVRMTRFGDWPGFKASNPVVSPDGRSFVFQEGRSSDAAGVGYGIFLLNLN